MSVEAFNPRSNTYTVPCRCPYCAAAGGTLSGHWKHKDSVLTNPTPPSREELKVMDDGDCRCIGCRKSLTLLAVMDACTPERLEATERLAGTYDDDPEDHALAMDFFAELRNALGLDESGAGG